MYDVIVIGARCAGSPTAMLLARRGYRVLVVDKASFPSDTVSTHLVKPRGLAYLRRWGLLERLRQAGAPIRQEFSFTREGITLEGAPAAEALRRCLVKAHDWDANTLREEPVEWACIRRKVLDKVLVDAAREAGAEVREGFTLRELLFDESGRVTGIRGSTEQGGLVEERARVVVGADGRHSLVARLAGAAVLDERPRCSYTVYSYFSGINVDAFKPPVHLRGRLGIGFATTNEGLALVSVWGPREWFPSFRGDLEGNLLRSVGYCYPEFEEALRSSGRREERISGTVDLANVLRRSSGPGWMLVGDAGCHVDQCTAIGITQAFRDAELASASLHRGLSGEQPLDVCLAHYEERRLEELRPYFEYVAMVSECNPPRLEQVRLLAALRSRREHVERFLGYGAAIVQRSEYFSPREQEQLVAEAAEHLRGVPSPHELEALNRQYEANPWL